MRLLVAVLIVGVAALGALPADAQQGPTPQAPPAGVQIQTAPTPGVERPARVVPPPLHYESTRPPDADFYPPAGPRVEHDPAFLEPLATRYETPTQSGRVGLSGWVSPNMPVGSPQGNRWKEVTGYFALGFSVTWDGPPAAPRTRPPAR
jgi:hypothetical protein